MLEIKYDKNKLWNEFIYYKLHKGSLSNFNTHNYIVKYFQQNIFFKKENKLFENDLIKEKLLTNRSKYLNKSINELTDEDLLAGFKKSGIYWGYSHFNPLIFKYFIEEFNVNSCYDPCGGWGHRLLGSLNLSLYIYNDLSITIYNNVKHIINEFDIKNVICYNNDANNFIPRENFDSMFTCPPYYNLEKYECKIFDNIQEYYNFIDNLFNIFLNSNAIIFGLVIREDLLDISYQNICYKKYLIQKNYSYHFNKTNSHKNNEYLYIFIKNEL